jgi:hypothetical protein
MKQVCRSFIFHVHMSNDLLQEAHIPGNRFFFTDAGWNDVDF